MLLIVDQNIPMAEAAFAQFGTVRLLAGRGISPADVRDADALIVRSITKVNEALLGGSRVRFVGTATIGIDHLDTGWLDRAGIPWASAAGCNANSVVEWVFAALLEYSVAQAVGWRDKTLGIVGHGNIGSRLAARARLLGMKVLVCDPPLHRAGRLDEHVALDAMLPACDFLSFHVPLVREGEDRTIHLLNEERMKRLRPGCLVLNASRGDVIATRAILTARPDIQFILDVFENEPNPDLAVLERCFLVSPHVAGYSHEGKINGTRMMAEALARTLGRSNQWYPELPAPPEPEFSLTESATDAAVLEAIRHAYRLRDDDAGLRAIQGMGTDAERGAHFDALRKNYPKRREFRGYRVLNAESAEQRGTLQALGFAVG